MQSWSFGSAKPHDPHYRPPQVVVEIIAKLPEPPAPTTDWATEWAQIGRLGYELKPNQGGGFNLSKGGELVTPANVFPYGIAFSESGKRFAWVLNDSELLTETGKQPWHQFRRLEQRPFFIDEAIYWVQVKDESYTAFQVMRESEVLYEGALNPRSASIRLEQFQKWKSHWIVETAEADVIIDGQSLKKAEGYQQTFFWRLFHGKPIYLYEKGGKYGINWDGKDLGLTYDKIFHGGCCDSTGYNPQLIKDQAIALHVRQGEKWSYVLITK